MGDDPNKVEMEVDIGGDAVEVMKQIADQTDRAADAEERLAKNARVTAGLQRQRQAEMRRGFAEQQRQNRETERHERRVTAGLNRQRSSELQARYHERERQRDEDRDRRERVLSGLDSQRQTETRRAFEQSDEVIARRRAERMGQEKRVQERLEAMGFGKRAERPLTDMQEAGRRILSQEREERIRREMERHQSKPGMTGLGGLAQKAEGALGMESGTLSGLASKAGGMLSSLGPLAMLATAGKFAVGTMTTINDQMQYGSPYTDGFVHERNIFGNLPLAREFYAGKDMLTGRAQGIERVNRARIEREARAPVQWEAYQVQVDLARDERLARLNAQSVRANPLPDFPGGPRGTLGQQQQYHLAQKMLPLQEQLTEASTARAEAENAVTAAQERQKKLAEESRAVQDRITRTQASTEMAAKAGALTSGDPEYVARLNRMALDSQRAAELEKLSIAGRLDVKQKEEQAAYARRREADASSAHRRGGLADLQRREEVAGSQAERLTLMGPEGRLRGQQALMMMRQTGNIGMLPPELISAGLAYGGEEVRARAREEGQMYVTEAQPFAPEEYRDTLPGIRREVDRAGSGLQGKRQADREAGADDLVRAIETGGANYSEKLMDALKGMFKKLEDDVVKLKEYQGTEAGYRPPRG